MTNYYCCLPADTSSVEGKKFLESAWCGEAYDTKRDAVEHKKFFEKHFNCKFIIDKNC